MEKSKTEHRVKHHEEQHESDILEWRAPGRPFIKRSRQFFLTVVLITLFVEIIVFLFSQYLLMFVIAALVFLSFALSIIPPRDFYYKISSEGIQVEDYFHIWHELYDFYFIKENGTETLHVSTVSFYPGELIITFPTEDKEKIKEALIKYLPFREYVKPDFMQRSADWLSKNFPLERS